MAIPLQSLWTDMNDCLHWASEDELLQSLDPLRSLSGVFPLHDTDTHISVTTHTQWNTADKITRDWRCSLCRRLSRVGPELWWLVYWGLTGAVHVLLLRELQWDLQEIRRQERRRLTAPAQPAARVKICGVRRTLNQRNQLILLPLTHTCTHTVKHFNNLETQQMYNEHSTRYRVKGHMIFRLISQTYYWAWRDHYKKRPILSFSDTLNISARSSFFNHLV